MDIIRKHTYVGMADETHALLQHGTRLYLLNIANLSRDMFYQQVQPTHIPCMCLPPYTLSRLVAALGSRQWHLANSASRLWFIVLHNADALQVAVRQF